MNSAPHATHLHRLRALTPDTLHLWLERPVELARARALLAAAGAQAWLLGDAAVAPSVAGATVAVVPAATRRLAATLALVRRGLQAGLPLALQLCAEDAACLLADPQPHPDLARLPLLVVTPPRARAAPAALAALRLAVGKLRWARPRFALLGWPPCADPDRASPRGLRFDLEVTVVAAPPMGRVQTPDAPAPCLSCWLRGGCPGWPAGQPSPPQPPPSPISNQADFIEDAAVALPRAAAEAPTPGPALAALATPPDAVAASLLIEADDDQGAGSDVCVRRFVCRDNAFAVGGPALPPGVEAALAQSGQLYLDASKKARLDDFAADLGALRRIAPPSALPDGRRLGGRYRRAPEVQPFADEERWLRAQIAALTGVVVDVGAGPLRYLDLLAPAIAAGHLRYIAVEPEAAALRTLRASLSGAILARGVGERLPIATGCADAALVLRAWNHLHDPARALRELARALRPGGSLLVVDNVAFGLLRTADAAARAHAISTEATPFEHCRNDDARDAAAWITADGSFEAIACREVGPTTSNQWSVTARRRAGGQGC